MRLNDSSLVCVYVWYGGVWRFRLAVCASGLASQAGGRGDGGGFGDGGGDASDGRDAHQPQRRLLSAEPKKRGHT